MDLKLNEYSTLDNFLLDFSTKIGKLYKKIYEEYSKIQNDLLNEIIDKINLIKYDTFKSQEINIQEAKRENLLIMEFENKSEFTKFYYQILIEIFVIEIQKYFITIIIYLK